MPDNDLARIVTCIYALCGVACVGVALGVIGNNVVAAQEDAIRQANKWNESTLMEVLESDFVKSLSKLDIAKATSDDSNTSSNSSKSSSEEEDQVKRRQDAPVVCNTEDKQEPDNDRWALLQQCRDLLTDPIVVQLVAIVLLLILLANIIHHVEGSEWTLVQTIYFAIITGNSSYCRFVFLSSMMGFRTNPFFFLLQFRNPTINHAGL